MTKLRLLVPFLLSLLGLPLLAQTTPSPVTGIGGASSVIFQNGGTPIGTATTVNCSTNLTCTFSGGTVTIVSGTSGSASFASPGSNIGGDCVSITSNGLSGIVDAGFPCANIPSTAAAHSFLGNNTGSSGPISGYINIGTSDFSPNIYCVTSGSADAYVAAISPVATALTAGTIVNISPNFTNTTTTPTVNLSTLGAKNILKAVNGVLVNVVAGDIATGVRAELLYDGTQFQLLNPATTRSMWPCAPQAGLTDTIDNTTSPTETLFTTVCKIPANTFITGVVIDAQLGIDWTATTTVPNSTFKAYLCPTQASLTGCKGIFTGTTSAASAGTFSTSLPIILIGRSAAGATANISQQISAGVGASTPWGRNTFSGNVGNIPTNADLFLQFSVAIAANTAGNSYTIRSLIFR